ncbi:mechanosensitive ion channel domain-containing protein [Oceanibaculum pacificum]|uniref:Mechanosensitive ion channel protein n=1 Tax=Oceanibaculum pacificum TaxID=580166 RepID=A0A154W328_9PROT|nr:mechanosensitive ion channel domain-containing protein [Oceanibaculum pacificum]KZD07928.1 hypothetical protein AUP43_09465 [Oceanibaculum pacificum]
MPYRSTRLFAALLLACLLSLPVASAMAQALPGTMTSGGGGEPAPTEAQAEAQTGPKAELQSLVDTLKDDQRRQNLIRQIETLIQLPADAVTVPRTAPAAAAAAAEEEGMLGRGLSELSEHVGELSGVLVTGIDQIFNLDRFWDWSVAVFSNPDYRNRLLLALGKIALVVAAGYAAHYIVRLALTRPRRALAAKEAIHPIFGWLLLLLRGALELIPIAAFFGAAQAVIVLTNMAPQIRLASVALIFAFVLSQVIMAGFTLLLAPKHPERRRIPLSDETANYLHIWARRFTYLAVFGLMGAHAAALLGLPLTVYGVLRKIVYLALAAMAVIFILQNRKPVAEAMRGPEDMPEEQRHKPMSRLRRRLAGIWHLLALLYVVAAFAVLILGIAGGFAFISRATALTLVALVIGRVMWILFDRLIIHGFSINPEMKQKFPTLELRANRYLPILSTVFHAAIIVVVGVAILQAWGFNAFGYITSTGGQRLIGTIISILIILGVAAVAWEFISLFVERYLKRLDESGQTNTRAKTLLPLIRNALLIVLITMVTLIVLSELGVNIAPLLAGAGVVGLAIGFGSQALVKDVITGLFLLVEDTINVGDVVQVGTQSGVVEAMSIRTIKLRDLGGNLHTIPFGSVDIITNMTKDYGRAVIDVGVAYRENVDEVIEVLRKVGEELAADENYKDTITAPMEIFGVQALADSSVTIRCRFTTKVGMHWAVGREMNRRIKNTFDKLGIEIPFPHQTLYFGTDQKGGAPAAHIVLEKAQAGEEPKPRTIHANADAAIEQAAEGGESVSPPPELRDQAEAKANAAKEEAEKEAEKAREDAGLPKKP